MLRVLVMPEHRSVKLIKYLDCEHYNEVWPARNGSQERKKQGTEKEYEIQRSTGQNRETRKKKPNKMKAKKSSMNI